MKDFLETIVKQIVESPESVVITQTDDNGKINLQIKVADEDMGRVIGKEGKVINAIRMIMRVMAIRQNVRVRVDIEDNRQPMATPEPNQEPTPEAETPVEPEPVAPVSQPVVATTPPVQPTPAADPTASDLVGQPVAQTPAATNTTTVLDNSQNN